VFLQFLLDDANDFRKVHGVLDEADGIPIQ
jgi:hypothetical protein